MASKRARDHPNDKTKYRVENGPDSDRALVARGDLTLWIMDLEIESPDHTTPSRRARASCSTYGLRPSARAPKGS